jgi:hypothetical protein
MSEQPPLTTPFTQSVQLWGYYSYFTLPTTLHRDYHMVTCVPSGQALVRQSLCFRSLSHLLNEGPHLHEYQGPPLRSCPCCPVRKHKMRRSIRELMYAEVNCSRWRQVAFSSQLSTSCYQIQRNSMHVVMPRGGGFGARHPAHVPNSSPSHVRFKESTPISQSCDLFSEGPRKRHPHALGLDELI